MCHVTTGLSFDRPICENDIIRIHQHYKDFVSLSQMRSIYNTITDKNHPQPAVLLMVVDLIARHKLDDKGMYPLVIAPFSGMDLQTGERVQSKEMYAFHTVFESFALAQRNVRLLNQYLSKEFGGEIVLFCDCGCGFRPNDGDRKVVDGIINDINAFRAYYEAIGTAVIKTDSFDDKAWQQRTVDLGSSEKNAYTRMYRILQSLPHEEMTEPVAIQMVREFLAKRFTEQNEYHYTNIVSTEKVI